jgi:hypothetical protein
VNGLQNQKRLAVGQPLLVPLIGGASDPQLPDLPATPVSLPKALQAAKAAAHSKTVVAKGAGGRASVQKAVQPRSAQKVRQQPVRQLRAENGKRVKVVTAKPAASRKSPVQAPRVKVAAAR